MASQQSLISVKCKEQYLSLLLKQKSAALIRYTSKPATTTHLDRDEQELLQLNNQPVCCPRKLKSIDAIPMSDDDYLLAELNGHFA